MTSATRAKGSARLLAPIRLMDGRFTVVDIDDVTQGHFQDSLRRIVERRYQRSDQYVEFNGRVVHTTVFLSGDGTEGYTELDGDGNPVNIDPPPEFSQYLLVRYLRGLMWRLAKSDGITVDTEVALQSDFVEPNVSWVRAEETSPAPWEEVRRQTRLVVLGGAGAGKTSVLRRLAYDWARESLESRDITIPVYVQLRDFAPKILGEGQTGQLAPFLSSNDVDLQNLMKDGRAIGRVLLILDGLDEIPNDDTRAQVLELVNATCVASPTIRVMLSTREPTYRKRLSGFTHARLDPFDQARISQWSFQYLTTRATPDAWRIFLGHLSDVPDIAKLATNPLLLSIIAHLYAREHVVPENKALVLERCLEALLQDWDAVRGVQRWPDSPAMTRQMRAALMDMSVTAALRHRDYFRIDDLDRRSQELVGFRSSPTTILNACTAAGIVGQGEQGWTFVHRTFQDYLAARSLIDSTHNIRELFGSDDVDLQRDRIWELACALASDASDLLDAKATDSELTLLRSAMLLAGAFGQDITATRTAVRRACSVIRTALERHVDLLSEASQIQLSDLSMKFEGRVWAVAVISDRAPGGLLTTVLQAIHKARLGTAATFLKEALDGSEQPIIRHIAKSMQFGGRCEAIRGLEQDSWLVYAAPRPHRQVAKTVLASDGDEAAEVTRDQRAQFWQSGDQQNVDPLDQARGMTEHAAYLKDRGELDQAEQLLQAAHRMMTASGLIREAAAAMGGIADIAYQRGDYGEALRIRREIELPVYLRSGDVREAAVCHGRIADILYQRGDYGEALRVRREIELPVYERLGDARSAAVAWGEIADILYQRGDYGEALRVRREIELPVYERLGDARSAAVAWGEIADILYQRGDYGEALRIRREIELPVYERLGDTRSVAVCRGRIADILYRRRDYSEAAELQHTRLRVYEEIGDLEGTAAAKWGLALIDIAGRDYESAFPRLADSFQTLQRLQHPDGVALVGSLLGRLLLARGQEDEASDVLRISLAAATKTGATNLVLWINEVLAHLLDQPK
ncbi:NACHT domain-containing protein [Micromonospora profundi]|uniref:NACHT domain-containing protein n=1 Tax=Micromonospora profundi TaxID=1420889 RepID=UPI002FEF1262